MDHRVEYLHAMGIQCWRDRDAVLAEDPKASVDGYPPVEEAASLSAGSLEALEAEVAACESCSLYQNRTRTVFGMGNPNARLMFVGEAPGAEEDRQGLPFVGRAGQLLEAMLQAIGLKRSECYIANVLKCRPPNNRDPMGEEVRKCSPYLLQQIELIKPDLLVAMGRFAAQALLKTDTSIGKLRGTVHQYSEKDIPLIVTYHPAYLLRSPLEKRKAWQDLKRIRKALDVSEH